MLIVRKSAPKLAKSYKCNAVDMPDTWKTGKRREETPS
jgi:hypothetical protein